MAFPDNIARAVFQFTLPNGSFGYCTPHFRSTAGDFTSGKAADLAALLESWYTTANFQGETNSPLDLIATDQLTLSSITVTSLATPTPVQATESVNATGNQTFAPLPNESSLVTTIYTGLVGRSYRGRNYWPVLGVNYMQDNGTILDATVATLQACFDALLNGLQTEGNFLLGVYSATLPGFADATSVVVRDTVHHQRRRNS